MKSTQRLKNRRHLLRWCCQHFCRVSSSPFSSACSLVTLAVTISLVLLLVQVVQVQGVRDKFHLDLERSKLSQFQKSKFHIQQQQNQQNFLRKHEPEEKRSESEFVKGKSEYFEVIKRWELVNREVSSVSLGFLTTAIRLAEDSFSF